MLETALSDRIVPSRTEAAQQEAAGEKSRHGQRQSSTEECSFLGYEDRYVQIPRSYTRNLRTCPGPPHEISLTFVLTEAFYGPGKFVFKLPAQVAYRGTRGAYRKMKRHKRNQRGMIFSEDGDHQVVEGPLHKWVNYLRGWRKRWFILESPGLLAYYSNHKKKACLGTIPLTDADVTISRRSPLRFVVDTDYGVFYLRATSAEQRDQWIEGIKESQILNDLQQGREPPISAGEGSDLRTPGPGRNGGYDEYDSMDDRIYGGYGSQSPEVAIDPTELDEVRSTS